MSRFLIQSAGHFDAAAVNKFVFVLSCLLYV